jgi:uncharacterized protein YbaP (TraB family)
MRQRRAIVAFAAVLSALAFTIASLGAQAHSFGWRVSRGDAVVYLVGSVHLLTPDFYPLPEPLETAYTDSNRLVEEVDLGDMLTPGSQLRLLSSGMLPPGTSLGQVVSASTLSLAQTRAASVGLPFEPLTRFKPWFLALTLEAMEWQKAGFDESLGLDQHFYDLAKKDGKTVEGLETVAYQISRFDEMTRDEQDKMLADSLGELDSEIKSISTLTAAWKAGDEAKVADLVLADLKDDPVMYQRILVERNRNWLPKIEALLGSSGRAFIVVGAAHLVGPDGLLQMLRDEGYRVEQL